MSGKLTIKGAREEELMEAHAYYANTIEDIDSIIELIDANEKLDKENDILRNEVMGHLLKALECYSCKDYEGVNRYIHTAIQRLHSQELTDLKDDDPRGKARIKLAVFRQKALHGQERIRELIQRCGKANR